MRLITPVTKYSFLARKSSRICSRSASRTFWRMTCLAAWAPIRPNSTDSSGSSNVLASEISLPSARSSSAYICAPGFSSASSSVSKVQRLNESYSPVSRSTCTRTSASSVKRFLVADANAYSTALNTTSLSTFFSCASASTNNKISRLIFISA